MAITGQVMMGLHPVELNNCQSVHRSKGGKLTVLLSRHLCVGALMVIYNPHLVNGNYVENDSMHLVNLYEYK